MFQIEPLLWDTDFFGYKIGKLQLVKQLNSGPFFLPEHDYRLLYIFSENRIESNVALHPIANLVDIKIEFIKSIQSDDLMVPFSEETIDIREIKENSDSLMHLVIESGNHSRFRIDDNFKNNEFERLYYAWIEKALIEKDAWVFGAFADQQLLGFVSLFKKDEVMDIALIAVEQQVRGKHIGKRLLEKTHQLAIQEKCAFITVATQENNEGAMNFYKHNGFKINRRTFIYHWWN